jgi:hypothetical protein
MLDLQYQYNNYTTTPHMRVDHTHCDPSSCKWLLCSCCDSVVQESRACLTSDITEQNRVVDC